MNAVKPVLPAGLQATAKTAVAGSAIGIRNAATISDKRNVFFESLFFILDCIVFRGSGGVNIIDFNSNVGLFSVLLASLTSNFNKISHFQGQMQPFLSF